LANALNVNGPLIRDSADRQARDEGRSASTRKLYSELRKRGYSDEKIEEKRSRVLEIMRQGSR
jgi:hypothetical protein